MRRFWAVVAAISICLLFSSVATAPARASAVEVSRWYQDPEILHEFRSPPNEAWFLTEVQPIRVDPWGAEFRVGLTDVQDRSCTQEFRVGWDFGRDLSVVEEGETIEVVLYNEPLGGSADLGGMKECYERARSRTTDGGRVVLELKGSGGAFFFFDPEYSEYHPYNQGLAAHLFSVPEPSGMVYPVDPDFLYPPPVKRGTGTLLVFDGIRELGDANAPRGNFAFAISKGKVFTYNVAYLFDAPDASLADVLGRVWQESESGWQGVWTRRGTSNVFDAVWADGSARASAELTITISGDQVTVDRRNQTDSGTCDYVGTLADDGVTVTGTYSCSWAPGPFDWSATIQH
jgi:alkylated DNA nucleotide flippase Atl1